MFTIAFEMKYHESVERKLPQNAKLYTIYYLVMKLSVSELFTNEKLQIYLQLGGFEKKLQFSPAFHWFIMLHATGLRSRWIFPSNYRKVQK